MMVRKVLVIFSLMLSVFGDLGTSETALNITAYYEMPSLFEFDDYDKCLRRFPQKLSTYCLVRSDLVPNAELPLFKSIEVHSADIKRHFDHRHLYHGLCVDWCEKLVETFNGSNDYFAGLQTSNYKINIYTNLFSSKVEREHRDKYNILLNQCVNHKLSTQYNLTAISMIEYCTTNKEQIEHDRWNFTFYGICLFITAAVITSSFYDLILKNKSKDVSVHYKMPVKLIWDQILTSFSVTRNWYRLTVRSNNTIGRDLRFLDCFKTCTIFIVIFGHTCWIFFETGIINTFDIEALNHSLESAFISTGCIVTLTFFVISGCLLSLNYHRVTSESNQNCLLLFTKFNVFRYLRLTIPYAFVVLLTGVYFKNLGGPMWKHIVEKEQLACRRNWWLNLLYINNYAKQDESCMIHGWYLAADTQIFLVSLLILILGSKLPKLKNLLYGAVIAFGMILTAIIVYLEKFDGIFIPAVQGQKDDFIGSSTFRNFYTAPHINFSFYFIGIITGQLYIKLSEMEYTFKHKKAFVIFWYTLIPSGLFWMLIGQIFVSYDFEKPAIWIALFAALQKNLWAFGVGVMILGMSIKCGSIIRRFSCHPIFRVTGRLTYGVFLCHLWYIRMFLGMQRTPYFFEPNTIMVYVVFIFSVSYMSSFVLAMTIELPVSALMKLLLK